MDGSVYFVSGSTGCVTSVDVGHRSYTTILADDVLGTGRMQLIVSTLSGHLFVFDTPVRFAPLKAVPSRPVGPNVLSSRDGFVGIELLPASRAPHEVRGDHFYLSFKITDDRPAKHNRHMLTGYYVT